MTGTFQIISERVECFTGRRGKIEQRILTLLDQDNQPLLNTVDYLLHEEEKLSGPCRGKTLTLAITDAAIAFGGRLRLKGRIVSLA